MLPSLLMIISVQKFYSDVSSFVGQAGTHIESTKAPPWLCHQFVPPNTLKNALGGCLFLDFFLKHLPNYLSLHYENLFVDDLKIRTSNKKLQSRPF